MAVPVLLPKITPPRRGAGTLARRRLLDILHAEIDRKLLLTVAPAGYGKSTLIADFAAEASFPVCWYTLGREDRDLKVFLAHFVAALAARFPGFGQQTQALLERAPDPQRELPALVATLANEIFTNVTETFALVLDDFHTVDDSQAVNQAMDELLKYLPDNCRILLLSRTVPRITFTNLVARMQISGLGTNELRFTGDEVRKVLKERHKVLLMPDQAEKLAEESEGWITGILLTTHSLWRGLLETLERAKGQGEPFVYDYLAAEVLQQQPPEVQDFLFASSVPRHADPTNLEALLGLGPWEQMLERVESGGLFLDRLEGDQPVYRYHNLFRDFLQQRLETQDPPRSAALQRRAAELAAEAGDLSAAVGHYRRAGAPEDAAALLEARADVLVAGGTWRLLADLVDGLDVPREGERLPRLDWMPDAERREALEQLRGAGSGLLETPVLAQHPRLRLLRGQAGFWLGELPLAEAIADDLARTARGADRARALLLRGNARRFLGRLAEAEQDLADAAAEAAGDAALSAEAELLLGICNGLRGDLEGSTEHLRKTLPLYASIGDERNLAFARYNLGVTCARRGALDEAAIHYRAALDVWERLSDCFSIAESLQGLGNLHATRGQYERAAELLGRALDLARQVGYVRLQAYLLDSLATVQRARGDIGGSLANCEEGLDLARRLSEPAAVGMLLDGLANSWRLYGDADKAEHFAEQALHLAEEHESHYDRGISQLTLGAVALGRGESRVALTRLRSARNLLERAGAKRDLARVRLRLAQALWKLGEEALALREARAVARALRQGGQYGLLAPEAVEYPAVLRAVIDRHEGPELARLFELTPHAPLAGQPLPAAVRAVESESWTRVLAFAFGPPRVECDGRTVSEAEWRSSKALELLFYLLANRPEATRDQIIEALWPEFGEARGQSNLWSTVYRLRRAIHPDAILSRRGAYSLNPALPIWEDAGEFERRLSEVDATVGEERAAGLRGAVELYRGAYLEGIYADWCNQRRTVLESRYLLALAALLQHAARSGSYHQGLQYAQSILALDPYQEDANRHTIELHGRLGDRAGGVRHFQRYAELMRDELGEEPGPHVEAAYRALLRGSRALA